MAAEAATGVRKMFARNMLAIMADFPLRIAGLCTSLLMLVSPIAVASTTSPTYAEEYSNVVSRAQTGALDTDLFGERINLSNGATEFSVTDIALNTNGQIPLTFGRKLVVNNQANYGGVNNPASEILGRFWQIDVPYMRGIFPQQLGWIGSNYSAQRCSYGPPPSPVYGVGPFGNVPYENNVYWTGTTLNIPGRGEEELDYLPANRPRPIDGRNYSGGTKSEWRVACLPAIKNGPGEGFIAVLPDGTKYYFDWIAGRSTAGLVDTYCAIVVAVRVVTPVYPFTGTKCFCTPQKQRTGLATGLRTHTTLTTRTDCSASRLQMGHPYKSAITA